MQVVKVVVAGCLVACGSLVACGGSVSSDLFAGDGGSHASSGNASGHDTGTANNSGGSTANGTTTGESTAGGSSAGEQSSSGTVGTGSSASTVTPPPGIDGGLPPVDAGDGQDTGSNTGGVACGTVTCSGGTPVCCVDPSPLRASCVATAGSCTTIPVECATASDCPGEVCCADYTYNGQLSVQKIVCSNSCNGNGKAEVCNPANMGSDCPDHEDCNMIVAGYGYCAPGMGGGMGGMGGNGGGH